MLKLFKGIIAVYSEYHTKKISTRYGQTAEVLNAEPRGEHS
jgi:hypothetical protein